jgi:hypothetical protein
LFKQMEEWGTTYKHVVKQVQGKDVLSDTCY